MYFKTPITKIGIIKTPLNQFHRLAFKYSKWTLSIQILNEEIFGVCCLLLLLYNEGALKRMISGVLRREKSIAYIRGGTKPSLL